MESKKALLEKRNSFKAEAQALVAKEERSTEESDRISEIATEIRSIDSALADIETERANGKQVNQLNERSVKTMDEKLEKRAAADLFRGDMSTPAVQDFLAEARSAEQVELPVEERALQDNGLSWGTSTGAGAGGALIPTQVANMIIEKLQETSPVFALAEKIPSITGNLRIAREDDNSDDGFVGELEEVKAQTPTLKSIELTQKRVGASMQLSNLMINDGAPDIVNYAVARLGRSLAKALERAILIGAKTGETAAHTFGPVVGNADTIKAKVAAVDAVTVEELIGIYTALNPSYLDGSAWIVSRDVFNVMSKLKDGNNEYLVFKPTAYTGSFGAAVAPRPGYQLFGAPVYVSDQLNDNATSQIIFGNFQAGYAIMVKGGLNLTHVTADTAQALAGGHLVVLDGYMDGQVKNPAAFVTASIV